MSHIDTLPPLRDVIDRHQLATKKSLGQNFLLDLNITMKIARAAGDLTDVSVLEIGPGPGGLTRALLASGAKQVIAIERDERCLPALEEIAAAYPDQLHVISGDALTVNHRTALEDHGVDLSAETVKIAANLPYNIATPLLTNWLESELWPPFWSSLTLMFQREVAQRITAEVGDKQWGRLGVLAAWRCHRDAAFDLAPQAFWPPPKVTSTVVQLEPKAPDASLDVAALSTVTKAAFGQRRKMLRQSLKPLGGEALLDKAGLLPTARAENLSLEDFAALARAYQVR